MGKLKEKLLNNLTQEEMQEKMLGELSAFEYVEYIEKYKKKNNFKQLSLFEDENVEIPEEVLDQMLDEKNKLENEFWEEEYLYEINDSIRIKYSDSDILSALDKQNISEEIKNKVISKLNEIWNDKNGINF